MFEQRVKAHNSIEHENNFGWSIPAIEMQKNSWRYDHPNIIRNGNVWGRLIVSTIYINYN